MAIQTKNIEALKSLRNTARNLRTLFERFRKITSDPHCDKYDLAFNCDDRFAMHKAVSIHLDSYTGYYGNSGCSTFSSINTEFAAQLLIAALNKHKEAIVATMADLADQKADSLKADAEKELAAIRELIGQAEAEEVIA